MAYSCEEDQLSLFPVANSVILVGSQNAVQRCETTLELFCGAFFVFLAFLHALNLRSTSCKKGRLNISDGKGRQYINFELMLPVCSVMNEGIFSTKCALSGFPGCAAVFSSAKAGLFIF